MAETVDVKKNEKFSQRLASGVLWSKKGTENNPEEVFYVGNIDFGILGISKVFIFKRINKDGEKDTMPDYIIYTSYFEGRELSSVGSLWSKEYEDKGKKIPYLSGVLSAGIHGEYRVAVFNVDPMDRKSDKSPDKIIKVSISRERSDSKQETAGIEVAKEGDVI